MKTTPGNSSSGGTAARRQAMQYLERHGLSVATAESCTAGMIASRMAELPGAGETLECAFVVYDPRAKQRCLGVRRETIDECGLTSEEVALEMAEGALRHCDANVAVANTGVADDTDPSVPAGTQCFAWVFRRPLAEEAFVETVRFAGSRNEIRRASADYALERLVHYHQRMAPRPASAARRDARHHPAVAP